MLAPGEAGRVARDLTPVRDWLRRMADDHGVVIIHRTLPSSEVKAPALIQVNRSDGCAHQPIKFRITCAAPQADIRPI